MNDQQPAKFETSLSLLGRLRHLPLDQQSWDEFVERYGTIIFNWCRKWGLQHADSEDVTQTVLTDLAKQMASFQYDENGSFRSWLKTLAYRAWCDFLSRNNKPDRKLFQTEVLSLLESEDAINEFLEEIDRQAQAELLEKAKEIVKLRVQPKTWSAFEKTAIKNLPAKQVAQQLDMNIGAVYVAKSKVIKQLQQQIEKLSSTIVRKK